MAITTYAELQAAAAAWLIRGDLTARIKEFIALAEARLNRVVRKRQAEVDYPLTATTSSRTIALPATFSEPLNLWIERSTGRSDPLRFIDPALLLHPQFEAVKALHADGVGTALTHWRALFEAICTAFGKLGDAFSNVLDKRRG